MAKVLALAGEERWQWVLAGARGLSYLTPTPLGH
jgi:hypothetical protein